jgi:hypothetical protein
MSSFASPNLPILPKLVLIFGDSGSGKSVAENAFQEHSFVPLHPIQDLKTFLESMCDLPAGSLHTPNGKASVPNFYRFLNNKMDILFDRCFEFLHRHYTNTSLASYPGVYNSYSDLYGAYNVSLYNMTQLFINHILLPDSVDHLSLKDLEICAWSVMRDRIDPEFSAPFLRHSLDFLLLQRRQDVVIGAIRNPHELSILQSYILSQSCIPYCISIQRPSITSLNTDVDQPKLLNWCLNNLPSEQCFKLYNSHSLEQWSSFNRQLAFDIKYRLGSFCSV